ncbi:MAG: hypothetical protein IKZ43_06485, partial [Acidaminococcaceae bacterium]|nr:hypothetical protein [Acidaminococcaceae bacterium]
MSRKYFGKQKSILGFPYTYYSASFFLFLVPGLRPRFFGAATSAVSVTTSTAASVFFLAVVFLAELFLVSVPSSVTAALFFAVVFLAVVFFVAGFFSVSVFSSAFLAVVFLAAVFRFTVFLAFASSTGSATASSAFA